MSQDANETSADLDRWSEALSWRATLGEGREEGLTTALGRRWQEWYANPENRRTFDAVNGLLAEHGKLRKRERPTKAEFEADEYDLSVPIAEWRKAQALNGKRKPPALDGYRWRWAFGGIAVAAAAVIATLVPLWPLQLWPGTAPNGPVVYQTGTGALQDVALRDGSAIVLGARTKLTVAYSSQRRAITLFRGQAWFKDVHNPHWPFVVTAGDGTITAVGTAFVVTRYSDRVVVAVTEGTVLVKARPSGLPSQGLGPGGILKPVLTPIPVSRGNELAFGENGTLSPIKPMDTQAVTAWTHGRLIFDNQPLRVVVEAVNRYSSRHIVLSPAVGALRFGGVVHDDEIGGWLHSLEAIFPVTVEERSGATYIQMRHSRSETLKPLHKT